MYESLSNKTALYVEDERDVLENISALLGNFFKHFYTASDGVEAFDIFETHQIDLLLVDVELPKMNGIELIKKVRGTDKEVMIIVVSAYTKTDYLLESVELGLSKYIVKPLTSKKIHMLLDMVSQQESERNIIHLTPKVSIDKVTSVVMHDETSHTLSKKELDFLLILAQKKMLSYTEIAFLWEDAVPTENAIRSYIKHLRKKLPVGILKNRNGIGYYLESHS